MHGCPGQEGSVLVLLLREALGAETGVLNRQGQNRAEGGCRPLRGHWAMSSLSPSVGSSRAGVWVPPRAGWSAERRASGLTPPSPQAS